MRRIPLAKSMLNENVETHKKCFLKCVQEEVLESVSRTDWNWIRNGLYPDSERTVSGTGSNGTVGPGSPGQMGPTE
jgi:hypothetical protein